MNEADRENSEKDVRAIEVLLVNQKDKGGLF